MRVQWMPRKLWWLFNGILCTEYCKCANICKNIAKLNYFVFSLFIAETHLVQDLTGYNMELFVKVLTNLKKQLHLRCFRGPTSASA